MKQPAPEDSIFFCLVADTVLSCGNSEVVVCIGRPQDGHAGAASDISFSQSGHFTRAILFLSSYVVSGSLFPIRKQYFFVAEMNHLGWRDQRSRLQAKKQSDGITGFAGFFWLRIRPISRSGM